MHPILRSTVFQGRPLYYREQDDCHGKPTVMRQPKKRGKGRDVPSDQRKQGAARDANWLGQLYPIGGDCQDARICSCGPISSHPKCSPQNSAEISPFTFPNANLALCHALLMSRRSTSVNLRTIIHVVTAAVLPARSCYVQTSASQSSALNAAFCLLSKKEIKPFAMMMLESDINRCPQLSSPRVVGD